MKGRRRQREEEEEAGHLGSFWEGNAYLLPPQWEENTAADGGREGREAQTESTEKVWRSR